MPTSRTCRFVWPDSAYWKLRPSERSQRAACFPSPEEAFGNYRQTQISAAGNGVGLPLPIRSFGIWNTGFNAAWELDVWGRIRRGIESADANLDASIENYDDVLVTLIADTATSYVDLRASQQRLAKLRENIVLQAENVSVAETRFREGTFAIPDVTQLDTTLYQSKAIEPVLERDKRLANNQLCVLLGLPPRDLAFELGDTGTETLPVPPEHLVVGIPADLIRRRPDVRQAERDVAAQSARIGIAASDLFPTLFPIQGQLNWQ